MNGIAQGFMGSFSGKGVGAMLAVLLVLAVLYKFAPPYTPEGVAARI